MSGPRRPRSRPPSRIASPQSGERDKPTLTLTDFDSHGTTRARYRNRWIEVEHGIPGEVVQVELLGKERPMGRIVDLLESAPDRTFPPCEYYREYKCGGCQWQHITYRGQISRKRRKVRESMTYFGLDLRVTRTHMLDEPWRYRTTAGISLGKAAGFRRHASLAIVPIRDCPISHPLIGQFMASLNDRIGSGELPDLRGRMRLDVRLGEWPDGERLQVLCRPDEQRPPPHEDVEALLNVLRILPEVAGISVQSEDGTIQTIGGDQFAIVTVKDRPVALTASSFFQTNVTLLPTLIERLQSEAWLAPDARVADVYGGVGIFGLFLAERAREVLVIESDDVAIEAGKRTAALWGTPNVRFVSADAAQGMVGEQFDVVVVDPPRTGLDDDVRAALIASPPPLLLYVSCLPDSLASDLVELLSAGYRVEHLEMFDFYPQTYHIELLAVLRLAE